ncbi:MAG: 2-oxoacid:acceptor oxidoreductase family protein [Candidatus Bathyarchaeia archaeon]|nr:2-oxoacid:acceptor oxidoreductase family protein [Candidatus Bathyarchaeota archaeon]
MYEVRWHGRAGQGVITVSRLLGIAAMMEGKHIQAFPEFGPERIGAPMSGFTRISDKPIEVRSKIYNPDAVIILDPTLPSFIDVSEGLKKDGKIIMNTKKHPRTVLEELGLKGPSCYSVDATEISIKTLGSARGINTVMLGALAKATGIVSMNAVRDAMKSRFKGDILEKNLVLLESGSQEVVRG